jgi:hypothetical protein
MNARTRLAVVAAAALTCLMASSAARAGQARFDLTGTWVGSIKCKGFNGGVKDPFTLTPTLKISQSGLNIGVFADYPPGDFDDFYTGYANPNVKKPLEKGEFVLIVCGTNDVLGEPSPDAPFDEIGRMSVSTKPPKVKATFKGTSIYSDPQLTPFSDPQTTPISAGTCKWKYTRIDVVDPGISVTCPVH